MKISGKYRTERTSASDLFTQFSALKKLIKFPEKPNKR